MFYRPQTARYKIPLSSGPHHHTWTEAASAIRQPGTQGHVRPGCFRTAPACCIGILQAATVVAGEGYEPHPEIMVPLVSSEQEMRVLANLIHATAFELFAAHSTRVDYRIGTTIEFPGRRFARAR